MYAAHASYSACGLGAEETDLLVELARAQSDSVAGAKISGGGSGGTVVFLVRAEDEERVAQTVADEYARRTETRPASSGERRRGHSPPRYGRFKGQRLPGVSTLRAVANERTIFYVLPRSGEYYIEKVRGLHVAMRDLLLRHLREQEQDTQERRCPVSPMCAAAIPSTP